jgi:hypothetical protein
MYRFTIRDLFWLTLVVAMTCAGMINLRQTAQRWNDALRKDVSKMKPPLMGRKSLQPDQ